jgi:hypothetical protein
LIGSVAQATALSLYLFFDGLTSLYVISALFGLFQGGLVPSYALIVRAGRRDVRAVLQGGLPPHVGGAEEDG